MSLRLLSLGLLSAAAFLATVPATLAADLDEPYGYGDAPQPIPETKVEFGSGWYVRGDMAATRLPDMGLTTSQYSAPNVVLKDGSQYGYSASLGAGYAFNNWFRADAIVDFHKPIGVKTGGQQYPASPDGYSGTCQVGYVAVGSGGLSSEEKPFFSDCHTQSEAKIQSYDVLVNGYLDLGHYAFATPYVGAGAGLSFGHVTSSLSYYLNDNSPYDTQYALPGSGVMIHGYRDVRVSGNYYNFAFALMAGVAFDVYAHTKLDIGYRYLNLGQVLGSTLQYHEARAGLRYMIDN